MPECSKHQPIQERLEAFTGDFAEQIKHEFSFSGLGMLLRLPFFKPITCDMAISRHLSWGRQS
jgi:hypothetical protein